MVASSQERTPKYISFATTNIAIAVRTVNGTSVNLGTQGNTYSLSKICNLSVDSSGHSVYQCQATPNEPVGDDVVGVLAYTTTSVNGFSGNTPLSFGEVEGNPGQPPTYHGCCYGPFSLTLEPVIYGGQVEAACCAKSGNNIGVNLTNFYDAARDAANAYNAFANTPYLVDSDNSKVTYLKDLTNGNTGTAIALTSPNDQITFINTGKEVAGQTITANLTFRSTYSDATFIIPPYFGLTGSNVSVRYTQPPPGSSSYLTFNCTSSTCQVH